VEFRKRHGDPRQVQTDLLNKLMEVVLFQPEIPPNTGNIARLCALTRSKLHLIEPMGFDLEDRQLKRAGMDYWTMVNWKRWQDWKSFRASLRDTQRVWFIESDGPRRHDEAVYGSEDVLVFGRESSGLPLSLLEAHRDSWLRIPMMHPRARSINLSNTVAIVLFEGLRQLGFEGEITCEPDSRTQVIS
jgi:tRNA (cytidine/uridine-2'-O-)-methyltransferase